MPGVMHFNSIRFNFNIVFTDTRSMEHQFTIVKNGNLPQHFELQFLEHRLVAF